MQSRRDQVQAYFFVVGRLVAAVVHGKPDVLQQPNKRMNTGLFLGVVVAAVLMGIFGIFGLFVPGGDDSWRQPGTIVMNEDSGARYVYLDGQLRPVLNYSSARLAAGGGAVVGVSQKSLDGVPVGQPIGIPEAPDALPDAKALDTGPWTVCAMPADTGPDSVGPTSTLLVGRPVPMAPAGAKAMLVRAPDGTAFLVWEGRRHRVPGRTEATALGYGGAEPLAVTTAWLNPIPQAPDLAVPRTPGTGAPGPRIDGAASVVGQVYMVKNPAIGTDQLYLVREDGVAPLSPTAAALLLAAPFTRDAYPGRAVAPIEVGPGALTDVPAATGGPDLLGGLPATPPELLTPTPDTAHCVAFTPEGEGGGMRAVAGVLPASVHTDAMPVAAHQAGATAERVAIPAGGGVLAREQSTPEIAMTTVYLITETGMKYPLAGPDVVKSLGYGEQSAVALPSAMLDLLPTGPLLSVEGALSVRAPVSP